MKVKTLIISILLLLGANSAFAQTTEFTYQGRLTDAGMVANGNYDFQFALFSAAGGGTQIGSPLTRTSVAVSNGVFTVQLDFGAGAFPGADRFLEIGVRQAGGGSFTTLLPRQQVTAASYSIRSLSAAAADTATNAAQLDGVAANQYVMTTDPRMTNARDPLPGSVRYVQNGMTPQSASNFNITGDGTAGGTLSGNAVNSTTQYNIGGGRVLTASSFFGNIFAGIGAGTATTGGSNSFFGNQAGQVNSTGGNNSFFGKSAGNSNTGGGNNSFFGEQSGFGTSTGGNNSFFGQFSGRNNSSGTDNAFFGYRSGANNTASGNSFFGSGAGDSVTTGANNAFFGRSAGGAVITGSGNAFFGYNAGTLSTAINNTFVGAFAGASNVTGANNAFFGKSAGANNTAGSNSFFGGNSGLSNTSGDENAFFGNSAGFFNTTGRDNAYFGSAAGYTNTNGGQNSFFGTNAGRLTNAAGSFFSGGGNAFFGANAGELNSTGSNNVFVGRYAGDANTTGRLNTAIGWGSDVGSGGLEYATAIGAGAVVTTNQTIVLGRSADSVKMPGGVVIDGQLTVDGETSLYHLTLPNIAAGQLCITADHGVVHCAGSFAPPSDQSSETQTQIAEQKKLLLHLQQQIDALKKLVCLSHPQADVCKAK